MCNTLTISTDYPKDLAKFDDEHLFFEKTDKSSLDNILHHPHKYEIATLAKGGCSCHLRIFQPFQGAGLHRERLPGHQRRQPAQHRLRGDGLASPARWCPVPEELAAALQLPVSGGGQSQPRDPGGRHDDGGLTPQSGTEADSHQPRSRRAPPSRPPAGAGTGQ